jgi:hypothetical protein
MWKLNACVLLFCLGMSLCADTSNSVTLDRKHPKMDMYSANEEMLDKMEDVKLPLLRDSAPALKDLTPAFLEGKPRETFSSELDKDMEEIRSKSKNISKGKVIKKMNSGITFIHLTNTKITESPEFIGYSKCQFKHGFLEILKNENYSGKKVELEMSRVELTPKSLKMYTTMDENSLFTTIKLDSILKISQVGRFKGTGCFDIILNQAYISEKFLRKRRITICAKDRIQMGKWVHSLFEFKECSYDLIHKNSKIVLDFNELNKIKKDNMDLGGLYYDNSNKVHKSKLQKAKTQVITKTVNNLINTIKIRNIEQAKVARTLDDQLKKAQAFTRKMERKNEMIDRILQKKREQQSKLEIKSVKDKAVGKVALLIKAMTAKIKDMKVNNF